MSCEYGDLFEKWELALVGSLISRLRRSWECLRKEDRDDLQQECLIHWYLNRKSYDPLKEVSRRGFMARVIRNRLMDLVREKDADKRKVSHCCVEFPPEDDGLIPSSDYVVRENPSLFMDSADLLHLGFDLERTVRKLTPRQQKICQGLGPSGLSAREVGRRLKIPSTTLHREIGRIRDRFEQAGLGDYLK